MLHFVLIVIGLIVGASTGEISDGFFGAIAGALIASLLYQAANSRSEIAKLLRKIESIEMRQNSIRVDEPRPDAAPTPSPPEPEAPPPIPVPDPVISPPPPPPPAVVPAAMPSPATRHEPAPVVHERVPTPPPAPSTFDHLVEVAKRWLTTGNVPVKVGILISFFGVAFLLKYAIDNAVIEIPISMRYLGIAIFAAVLMGLGWRMRESNRVYALSLQGGGIGVLFLVVFAAFRLHGLLPPFIAFALLVVLTAAAGFLAVRQESRALAILGTTGGFLAPLLVSTGSGNHIALFSYYLVLNSAVLGVAWYRAWRELNIIGFAFTFGVGTIWGYQYYEPALYATTGPFLALFFLFYTVIAVLFAFRAKPKLRGFVDGTLVFGTPTIAFALQTQMLADTEYGLATTAGVVAAIYAALALWLRSREDSRFDLLRQSFISLGVAFGTIAIPLALDERWTALAWALEGAALVWIGVKQSTSLAKATGIALAFASGVVFLENGWIDNLGVPVFNGNFIGAALIGIASLFSGRQLHSDERPRRWQAPAGAGLAIWGFAWWFGAGSAEIFDRVVASNHLHALMLFGSASFAVIGTAGKQLGWTIYQRVPLLWLPLLFLAALGYLFEHDHFLDGLGALAWPVALAAHGWVLFTCANRRWTSIWHGVGAFFFACVLAYELAWYVDEVVLNEVWVFATAMLVIGGSAFLLLSQRNSARWPIAGNLDSYYASAVSLVGLYVGLVLLTCINDPGDPAPMAYIPLLNPFDMLSAAGLALAWYAIRAGEDAPRWGISTGNRSALWLWGASAFALATIAVVRTVHHLAGVPWRDEALMSSTVVQTSLTIFWAAVGLAGMLLGTRRGKRSVWMIGVGLMGVVVLKLIFIDLGNTGTVARIISFLGVGVMLLVVGYFSPVPPRTEQQAGD